LLNKYLNDKVFLICIDSDTFFHGSNCIKEALDQCLYDIALDFQTKRKQLKEKEKTSGNNQQILSNLRNLPMSLLSGVTNQQSKDKKSAENLQKEQEEARRDELIEGFYYPFLVNSFSSYLPTSLQESKQLKGKSYSGGGVRGAAAAKDIIQPPVPTLHPLQDNSSISHHKQRHSSQKMGGTTGILETFRHNPLSANQTILSRHNWTVSSNTHIIWMGHLAWQQVVLNYYYREQQTFHSKTKQNWKHATLDSNLPLENVLFYPYPSSSLLSIAEKRNNGMKLLKLFQNHSSTRAALSHLKKNQLNSHYLCTYSCENIKLPEYLIYYFQQRRKEDYSSSDSSSTLISTPLPTVVKSIKHLNSSHSIRTSHKNHSHLTHPPLKTIQTPVPTHLQSTEPPIQSVLPLLNLTNDQSNHSTHNNNASWPHPTALLDYFNFSRTNSKVNKEETLLNMTLPYFPSNYSFHLEENSTFSHHNQTKRHRKLFSLTSSSKANTGLLNIPKLFRKKSIMRRNRTSYSFPLSALYDQSQFLRNNFLPDKEDDDNKPQQDSHRHQQKASKKAFCNPSIFLIGFTETNSFQFVNLLQSHPLMLSGYSSWTSHNSAGGSDYSKLMNENGCYNIITADLFASRDASNEFGSLEVSESGEIQDKLFYRSKCYPYLEKNDSFILLDSSMRYNVNPFTPFVIKQVKKYFFSLYFRFVNCLLG
jgi:hypothetical protein